METPPDKPAGECFCSKDDDGRCRVCAERLSAIMFQILDLMIRIPKMKNSLCGPCVSAEADWAGAKALRELFVNHPEAVDVQGAAAFVNNFVSTSGITKTPLMDAEVRRLSERKNKEGDAPSSER